MWGIDALGLPKYKDIAVNCWPDGWALGCFSSTFGDARPAVEAIIKTGKCPRVRVQLQWSDSHKYDTTPASALKEAKKWASLMAKYSDIDWQLSHSCEHELSYKQALAICDELSGTYPKARIVNCPMKQETCIVNMPYYNEWHGADVKYENWLENFSFDGSSAFDAEMNAIKERLQKVETFFFWVPQFNGKANTNDTTPRPQRTAWPSAKHFKAVIALAQPKGTTSLPPGWIYKPVSEKGVPVIITPIQAKQINLKRGNATIAPFKFYGPYIGGGFRYYAQRWGYQIASEPLDVWANGKQYGKINPCFRENQYR